MTDPQIASVGRGRYRIGAVAQATGLTTHTIRVWERRYAALHPERTSGGNRLYSDADVGRLRLLKRLQQVGHGIGNIAGLPDAELEGILAQHHTGAPDSTRLPGGGLPVETLRLAFMEAVGRLDRPAADRALSAAAETLPAVPLVQDFLAPVLAEIGDRWERGELEVAHEHAATAALRDHIAATMRVHANQTGGRRVVITTPAGELHEFGALLVAVMATVTGWDVRYLGPNLPFEQIVRAVEITQSRLILLSWVCAPRTDTLAELGALRRLLPEAIRLVVGGRAVAEGPPLPAGIDAVTELEALQRLLTA